MKFSQRIKFIYDLIDTPIAWDICCDHSQLALINLFQKKLDQVYCVDKSKESLDKIKDNSIYELLNLKKEEFPPFTKLEPEKLKSLDSIILIHKDGCQLDWSQVNGSVIIAGVGTHTALSIIESCPKEKRKDLQWILNPFNYESKFKKGIEELLKDFTMIEHNFHEEQRNRKVFKLHHKSLG